MLRAGGHDVFAPSLTGQGERNHLGGPNVGLTTHITDVENTIKYEDLDKFVLVGHSYGGMVITGVADRVADQITDLVYLDAFLPNDGESCFDLGAAGGENGATIEDGWKIMPMRIPNAPTTPEALASAAKASPQPIETFREKVRLSVPLEDRAFTRTYVKAAIDTNPHAPTKAFWDAAARTKADSRWRYYELPCHHGIHVEMPNELQAILYEVTAK
jgi:pimeloyl-ACP methyl ester carboxylesterase